MSFTKADKRPLLPVTVVVLTVTVLAVTAFFGPSERGAAAAQANAKVRPNIVVVMSDDQTVNDMRAMASVNRLLGHKGTTFEQSFVSFPLCCPSRSTFLTGQYAHNHGVLSNDPPAGGYGKLDHSNTLPVWLQRAGYYTGLIGKYLNGYGEVRPREIPPGWSEWYGAIGMAYFDYRLNENGTLVTYGHAPSDYKTDVFARKAVDFIRRRAPSPTPFFLYVAPPAPHSGTLTSPQDPCFKTAKPAPRHKGRFKNEPLPEGPSFNEADVSDKPAAVRQTPRLDPADLSRITRFYRCRLESLLSLDEAVREIVFTLASSNELANTLIVYTSDNGYLLGEHRLEEKNVPYEESIRVPLVMRGPGVPQGKKFTDLVANIDLAPTILDAANGSAGRTVDGRSLLGLLRDRRSRQGRAIVIENAAPGESNYAGVRTNRYVYLQYTTGERELYDLNSDPFELQNVADQGSYGRAAAELGADLGRLRSCSGKACRERPALSLALRYRAGRVHGRRCIRRGLRAGIRGSAAVERVDFLVNGRRVRRDTKAPFRRGLSRRHLKAGRRAKLRALVALVDGRELTIDRRVRACGR